MPCTLVRCSGENDCLLVNSYDESKQLLVLVSIINEYCIKADSLQHYYGEIVLELIGGLNSAEEDGVTTVEICEASLYKILARNQALG
jgi:hypothetical protein